MYAEKIPQPVGWVNDFAGVLSPEYKEKLNSLIEELEQKTTAEIVVVTINSIAPYDEKEYARLLFDNWKPGKKGKDNGVLVLLAIKERRWRIETGYGIEGILPDGLCGEIGRNYMVPYFKDGKYSEGLYYGVTAVAKVIIQNFNVSSYNKGITIQEYPKKISFLTYFIILLVLFVSNFISSFLGGALIVLLIGFAAAYYGSILLILLGIIVFTASLILFYIYEHSLPSEKRIFPLFGGGETTSGGYYLGGGGFGGGGFGGGFGGGCGGGGGAGGGF